MAGHDKITGAGREFFRQIAELQKLQVRVGYERGKNTKTDEDGEEADYCDIALWNELGTDNGIPSRPFMKDSVDKNESFLNNACKAALQEISKGGTAEKILKDLGNMQKGLVRETIVRGDFVPNAPSTVKKKGSDKPLIDSGGLRKNVDFMICKKGEYD